MPGASFFLNHPDPFTRQTARWYARGAFLMDNGDGVRFYGVENRALVPLTEEDGLHVSRRLKRDLKHFEPRVDTAFEEVVAACADPEREGRWITPEVQAALPESMYVFPVDPAVAIPAQWKAAVTVPDKTLEVDPAKITANRDKWLREWQDTVSG